MLTSTAVFTRSFLPIAACLLLAGGTARAADSGEATFKARCVMCHGADGSGNTGMGKTLKLRDLRSPDVQKMTDAQLTEIITKGRGKMPAYASLGPAGVQSVVGYLRELSKAKK